MFESRTEGSRAREPFSDVSGVLLAHLLAPVLADLNAVPDSVAGDGQLVDAAIALGRLEAWVVAQRARVAHLLVERTRAELVQHGLVTHGDSRASSAGASHRYDDERMAERTISTELALALGVTQWAADRDLELGAALAEHPELARALSAGRLDRRRAELVIEELTALDDPAARRRVLAAVVGDGSHDAERPERRAALIRPLRMPDSHLQQVQPQALRRAVRRACAAEDTDLVARREATARANRHLEIESLPDCMAQLRLVAPGYAVSAAFSNVDLAARECRRRGDPRSLDQLRCDIALGWLTEGSFGTLVTRPQTGRPTAPPAGPSDDEADPAAPGQRRAAGALVRPGPGEGRDDDHPCQVLLPRPRGALIVISMPDRTALGDDDEPATLHGPGGPSPMPASVARDIAHDSAEATWLGLYTDPRTGIATDISPRYRPPPRQRTFVMLRDGLRSRLPSSDVRRVELDHVMAYDHERPERGGQTTPTDLACMGLREHHLKTDRMLTVSGNANSALTFRTRTGHTYVSWPEVWGDPPY